MPLTIASTGKEYRILKINGNEEVKNHLADLGFVQGSEVSIINEFAGNIIVKIKESRVALDKNLANKIIVG